jgi:hypothetical protein
MSSPKTKRVPINRRMRSRITSAAVAAFRTCLELEETYSACIHGEGCFSSSPGKHCPGCHDYLEARRTLMRELNLPPWAISPADLGLDGPKPDYLANLASGKTWEAAVEWRRALQEAAAGK